MSWRKDWEGHKKALERMSIKPKIFKEDFGDALDAYEKADKKAEELKGGDKKKYDAAKKERTKKFNEAAPIMNNYSAILDGLTTTRPMEQRVIEEAKLFISSVVAGMAARERTT